MRENRYAGYEPISSISNIIYKMEQRLETNDSRVRAVAWVNIRLLLSTRQKKTVLPYCVIHQSVRTIRKEEGCVWKSDVGYRHQAVTQYWYTHCMWLHIGISLTLEVIILLDLILYEVPQTSIMSLHGSWLCWCKLMMGIWPWTNKQSITFSKYWNKHKGKQSCNQKISVQKASLKMEPQCLVLSYRQCVCTHKQLQAQKPFAVTPFCLSQVAHKHQYSQ